MHASWNYSYVLCLGSYAPCWSSRGILLINDLMSSARIYFWHCHFICTGAKACSGDTCL